MIYLDKHYGNAIMDGTAARLIEALGAIAGDSKFTDAKTLETIKASSTLNRENGNVFAISFDPNSSDVIGIKTADIPEERLLSVKTFSTDEELRMQSASNQNARKNRQFILGRIYQCGYEKRNFRSRRNG